MNVISVDLGWRHLAYVRMNVSETEIKIFDWKVVDVLTTDIENVNLTTIETLVNVATPKIFELVKTWKDSNPEIIFLEQQPMGIMSKNIKTKILSHIFQSLLVSQNLKVEFISPKRKLLGLADRNYAENKKFAITSTEDVLIKYGLTEDLDKFNSYKGKKDDLADCFLQGYYGVLYQNINKKSKKINSGKRKRKHNDDLTTNVHDEF